jgi:hypothetical protein
VPPEWWRDMFSRRGLTRHVAASCWHALTWLEDMARANDPTSPALRRSRIREPLASIMACIRPGATVPLGPRACHGAMRLSACIARSHLSIFPLRPNVPGSPSGSNPARFRRENDSSQKSGGNLARAWRTLTVAKKLFSCPAAAPGSPGLSRTSINFGRPARAAAAAL